MLARQVSLMIRDLEDQFPAATNSYVAAAVERLKKVRELELPPYEVPALEPFSDIFVLESDVPTLEPRQV